MAPIGDFRSELCLCAVNASSEVQLELNVTHNVLKGDMNTFSGFEASYAPCKNPNKFHSSQSRGCVKWRPLADTVIQCSA